MCRRGEEQRKKSKKNKKNRRPTLDSISSKKKRRREEVELTAAMWQCGGGGVRNHGVLRVVWRRLVGVREFVRRRRNPCSVCGRRKGGRKKESDCGEEEMKTGAPLPLFICGGGDRGCGFSAHGSRNGRGITAHDRGHDSRSGLTAARSAPRWAIRK